MLLLLFQPSSGGVTPTRVGVVLWVEFVAPVGVTLTVVPVDPLVFGAAL